MPEFAYNTLNVFEAMLASQNCPVILRIGIMLLGAAIWLMHLSMYLP